MKASRRAQPCWIPLTVAATLIGKLAVSAQDWQTVDDVALASGDCQAHSIAVDAAGRIFVVGTANGHGIVRYSADGGTNWGTRSDFIYPSESNNVFNAITVDSQGAVFVGGASGGHWIVRRSTDHGVTWQTVDDYYRPMISPLQPGTNGAVYSLSSDGQGRVYGAGLMRETGPSYNNWWVRGSGSGGTNWDTKLLLFSGYTEVSQIAWAGEDVYVTGSVSDGDITRGLIVRSTNFGATWTTNFEGIQDFRGAITHDSAANLYSAGIRRNSNSVDWLVRKAAPGSTNWTILDMLTYVGNGSGSAIDQAYPSSIAVDAAGNICVAGQFVHNWTISGTNGTTYGANQFWFTRQYSVATGNWSTTDLFPSDTNMQAVAMGTAFAPDGATFVVGYGTCNSGPLHWVVRKRAATNIPPRLQIAFGNRVVAVSWPAADANSILQWTASSGLNQSWQNFTGTVSVADGRKTAIFGPSPPARFFRLKRAAGP